MSSPCALLISYHFYPSNQIGARRATALARYLADRGVRVVVVSAFGDHDIKPGSEIFPGVIAIPVRRPRRAIIDAFIALKRRRKPESTRADDLPRAIVQGVRADTALSRTKRSLHTAFFRIAHFIDDFKKWGWRAAAAAARVGKQYGAAVVVSSAPPNSVLLAGVLAARRLGLPHIADLRDPWTDAVTLDESRRFDQRLQRSLEAWVMRNSAAITSAGATVASILARRYPRVSQAIHVVRNGFDGAPSPSDPQTGGRMSILFAGELYFGRNPFPFLAALEHLLAQPDVDASRVSVTLMGLTSSYAGQSLAEWLRGKRAEGVVRILPQSPAEAVAQAIGQATVLLNLAQHQPLSVPAKTYEQLASGREILLISEKESETAQLVGRIAGVHQVDPRDSEALEATLIDLYRRHVLEGRMSFPPIEEVMKYSRMAANEQFWSIIGAVARWGDTLPRTQHPFQETSSTALRKS